MKSFNNGAGNSVNDRAASGYFDVGTMRVQWGSVGSVSNPATVTLPAAFKTTSYSIVATACIGSANASAQWTVEVYTQSTTSFGACKAFDNGTVSAAAEGFSWIAIGLKP